MWILKCITVLNKTHDSELQGQYVHMTSVPMWLLQWVIYKDNSSEIQKR